MTLTLINMWMNFINENAKYLILSNTAELKKRSNLGMRIHSLELESGLLSTSFRDRGKASVLLVMK